MLHLKCESSQRWLSQVEQSLEEILIDHAHCEHKAAATAMSLLGTYIECEELCREMTTIVAEELDHFHQVKPPLAPPWYPFPSPETWPLRERAEWAGATE